MSLSHIGVGQYVSYLINQEQRTLYGVGSLSHISLINYYDFCVIKYYYEFCVIKKLLLFL